MGAQTRHSHDLGGGGRAPLANATPETPSLGAFADSRLTLDSGPLDYFIKSLIVSDGTVALIAGSSILPAVTAVEGARGEVVAINRSRRLEAAPPLSVLEEAQEFMRFFTRVYGALARQREVESEVLLVGHLADKSPAIVRVAFAPAELAFSIIRPPPGGVAFAAIGERAFKGLTVAGMRKAFELGDRTFMSFTSGIASVFWDAIKHQGEPAQGIGGGLSLGIGSPDNGWHWPVVSVEGQCFYRGLRAATEPDKLVTVDYDPTIFGTVERLPGVESLPSQWPLPILRGSKKPTDAKSNTEMLPRSEWADWKLSKGEPQMLCAEPDLPF